ncbi:MerR family transcriptional regulator [Phaeobacter sp. C3_T13_0]|uniref:MerR family transcriptional regulator n=1 Tax=Phaeobacter cretensis TaxID=3342641 RepID=UPI0039BCE4D9
MSKSPDAFRTISEVAEWLGIQAHVLRFWESKFTQIKPVKRAGGRRYYRPADVNLLSSIKVLLHDNGMSIKDVQALLREHGPAHVAAMGGGAPAEVDESDCIDAEASDVVSEPAAQDMPPDDTPAVEASSPAGQPFDEISAPATAPVATAVPPGPVGVPVAPTTPDVQGVQADVPPQGQADLAQPSAPLPPVTAAAPPAGSMPSATPTVETTAPAPTGQSNAPVTAQPAAPAGDPAKTGIHDVDVPTDGTQVGGIQVGEIPAAAPHVSDTAPIADGFPAAQEPVTAAAHPTPSAPLHSPDPSSLAAPDMARAAEASAPTEVTDAEAPLSSETPPAPESMLATPPLASPAAEAVAPTDIAVTPEPTVAPDVTVDSDVLKQDPPAAPPVDAAPIEAESLSSAAEIPALEDVSSPETDALDTQAAMPSEPPQPPAATQPEPTNVTPAEIPSDADFAVADSSETPSEDLAPTDFSSIDDPIVDQSASQSNLDAEPPFVPADGPSVSAQQAVPVTPEPDLPAETDQSLDNPAAEAATPIPETGQETGHRTGLPEQADLWEAATDTPEIAPDAATGYSDPSPTADLSPGSLDDVPPITSAEPIVSPDEVDEAIEATSGPTGEQMPDAPLAGEPLAGEPPAEMAAEAEDQNASPWMDETDDGGASLETADAPIAEPMLADAPTLLQGASVTEQVAVAEDAMKEAPALDLEIPADTAEALHQEIAPAEATIIDQQAESPAPVVATLDGEAASAHAEIAQGDAPLNVPDDAAEITTDLDTAPDTTLLSDVPPMSPEDTVLDAEPELPATVETELPEFAPDVENAPSDLLSDDTPEPIVDNDEASLPDDAALAIDSTVDASIDLAEVSDPLDQPEPDVGEETVADVGTVKEQLSEPPLNGSVVSDPVVGSPSVDEGLLDTPMQDDSALQDAEFTAPNPAPEIEAGPELKPEPEPEPERASLDTATPVDTILPEVTQELSAELPTEPETPAPEVPETAELSDLTELSGPTEIAAPSELAAPAELAEAAELAQATTHAEALTPQDSFDAQEPLEPALPEAAGLSDMPENSEVVVEPTETAPELDQPDIIGSPELVEPGLVAPAVTDPELAAPEPAETVLAEPEMAEPELVEPELIEPGLVETNMPEPETADVPAPVALPLVIDIPDEAEQLPSQRATSLLSQLVGVTALPTDQMVQARACAEALRGRGGAT